MTRPSTGLYTNRNIFDSILYTEFYHDMVVPNMHFDHFVPRAILQDRSSVLLDCVCYSFSF